jgi:hypothetical protein
MVNVEARERLSGWLRLATAEAAKFRLPNESPACTLLYYSVGCGQRQHYIDQTMFGINTPHSHLHSLTNVLQE